MVKKLQIRLEVNENKIEQQDVLKYLGVTADMDLSFGLHTAVVAPKAKRAIGALWRTLGKYCAWETFQKLYKTKILLILLHALPVSMPVHAQHWKLLEKLNRFACRLTAKDYSSSYQDLLVKLKWKPISQIAFERQMTMSFRYAAGTRYFPEEAMIPRPPLRRALHGHDRHALQLQLLDKLFSPARVPERQKSGRCPLFFALQTWNRLPEQIQGTELGQFDFSSFKRAMKSRVMFTWMETAQDRLIGCEKNPCLAQYYNGL